MDKVLIHTFFPSQDIRQNVLLSSYLDSHDVINFKIYLLSTPKAMADRGKRRVDRNTKFEYLENKENFLDEIKNIFHSF